MSNPTLKYRRLAARSGVGVLTLTLMLWASLFFGPGPVASVLPPKLGIEWRLIQENNIIEAVFRYEIARHSGYIHYLSVSMTPKDPSTAVMKRFDHRFVRPQSQEKNLSLAQIRTGLHDEYSVDSIHWSTSSWVCAEGSHIQIGGRAGGFGIYDLKFLGGRWMVVRYTVTGII